MQEATQKYWKLTDYRTKCCYLSALLSAYCDLRFLRLPQRQGIFSSWTQFWTSQVIIRAVYSFIFCFEISFSKLSLAKYHCLHKKTYIFYVFSYHKTSLQILFINPSVQIFLKLYLGGFTRNHFCAIQFIIIYLFISYKSEKTELVQSFKNCIIHISMQKVATISQFTRSD